jgi:palmitoyltransferase
MASLFRHSFRITSIQQLAIPGVSFLIAFLAYGSQYLFYFIEPGHLKGAEFWWFNGFVLALWWCYYKACSVDPAPKGWVERVVLRDHEDKAEEGEEDVEEKLGKGMRWCKKCKAVKPPRAHHCKQCGRYKLP